MTPAQFADLAAILTRHAESLGSGDAPAPVSLHRVRLRANGFFEAWHDELQCSATPQLYALLFAAELPLRIWCTVVASSLSRPLGRSVADAVFGELLEQRCLAMQALVAEYGLASVDAAALDEFRRRCERWADILVGPIARRSGVTDFAFCPERALEFAHAALEHPADQPAWPMIVVGMRLSFTAARLKGPVGDRAREEASQLAAALLSSLPHSSFDGNGRLMSPELARTGRIVRESPPGRTAARSDRRPSPDGVPPSFVEPPLPLESTRESSGTGFPTRSKRRPI